MTALHPKVIVAAVAITAMAQAATAPQPGVFGDPIVAMILRAISIILSLALSGTIILACIKMIAYFGAAGEAQRNLSVIVKEAGQKFDNFAHEMRELWQAHDREIIALKTNGINHVQRMDQHERRIEQVETAFRRRKDD